MSIVGDNEALERFQCDLEFVQFLSNPYYVQCTLVSDAVLIDNKYLDDPAFRNYLRYLGYFREPKYLKYIRYPICLKVLDKLSDEDFVK